MITLNLNANLIIVAAVEEGRKIYANIQKAIQFLLSSNLSEVIGIFVASMIGFTLLEPVQEEQVFGVMIGFYHGNKYLDSTDKKYLKKVKNW